MSGFLTKNRNCRMKLPVPELHNGNNEISSNTMTDTKSGKRDIHLWWALGIAFAAVWLRLWFINFPTNSHPDEPIIANLNERFVEQGILTADWAGFKSHLWSHPPYQFSP